MKDLIKLQDLTKQQIDDILNVAQDIIDGKNNQKLEDKIVANLFFEPSTRTHYSFNVAELKLNCKVINFSAKDSSLNKGETFYDTIKTFESFGVDALVIRSDVNRWYKELENKVNVRLINAGDGIYDHPTQTLLDLLTIKQEFKKLEGLKVLIVGDIAHSRVARSNIEAMEKMGMEVFVSAPKYFRDNSFDYVDFDEYLPKVDVINMLRIQNERLEKDLKYDVSLYNNEYGLNAERVGKMKNGSIIIHPAPFNRGVELNDDIVECANSRIFKQMTNGVYVRMAVLLKVLGKE